MPKNTTSPQELWLCLRFTHLSLNGLNIAANSTPAQAVSYQQKIWQHNYVASHSGIKNGMNVSHALTLEPELILHVREPQKEAQKYQNLSHWAYRFSSLVCAYTRDSLLLEIGKSIKLFNGLENITKAIQHDLKTFKVTNNAGLGKTPKAAYAISFIGSLNSSDSGSDDTSSDDSRFANARPLLENCELAKLELKPNTIKQLQGCGFSYLKDIQHIAKAELGQRFGADFLKYLRQLDGSLADPQIAVIPPEIFYSRVDFAEPINNLLWIQQQLDELLVRLSDFVHQGQLICHRFSWRFSHTNSFSNKAHTKTVTIALSAKQNNLQTLQSLSQLKLSHTQLDWEFSSIELKCTELSPRQLFNDDLFNSYADQEPFKQLMDRLSSRLGHKAVFGMQVNAEQLPELANGQYEVQEQKSAAYGKEQLKAYGEERLKASSEKQLKAYGEEQLKASCEERLKASHETPSDPNSPLKDQPLGLLAHPQKLTQHAKLPYLQGPLTIIHGPDRLSSHWWQKLQSRDYFIARQHSGRLLWIFYDRVQKNWFLHGLFS